MWLAPAPRLEEIFQIADRVTVLKDGVLQGTIPLTQTNTEDLISRMVGREMALHRRHTDSVPEANPVMLEVRDLTDAPELRRSRPFLSGISFKVRAGEVVVFAGLAGAGRTELALSLFGARPRASGEILMGGASLHGGRGTIWGTLLGVSFVALLKNVLLIINVRPEWQDIALGAVLVLAVAVDSVMNRNRK